MALIGDTSELDTLLYGGKYMLPEAASYTMTTQWGVVSSDVSGGFVRQQLQFFNSPAQVHVVYRCVTKARVDYLKAFIRLHEGLPFIAALAVDTDGVEPYVVDVVGAPTWQENGFSGTCTLTYQVQPTPNADYDEFLQWTGAAFGDDLPEFANWIAKTANEDLPDAKQMPIDATGTTASFVSGLYYDNVTPVDFSDLVAFSRLSAGSYIDTDGVLKTAAIGEPRFEAEGLLVEPQSTNYLVSSENCNFAKTPNTSITRDGEWYVVRRISAGGVSTYAYLDLNATNGIVPVSSTICVSCLVRFDTSFQTSGTFSAQARLDGSTNYQSASFDIGDNMRTTNLSAGVISASAEKISSGVYRVSMVLECTVSAVSNRAFYMQVSGAASKYEDGAYSYSIARPQIEALPFATSYIKTTGVAAARASDSAAVDMQPHTAGTIFAEFLSDYVAIERVVYTAGDVTLKRLATGAISVTTGAVTVTSAIAPSGSVKAAISYDGNTLKLAVNGVVYSASSGLPSTGVSIALGNTTFANVWQRSEAYDNARLIEVTQ